MSNAQQSSQSNTFFSSLELNSTSTSSSAALASILASALADVDRLKLEVEALTNRAVSAENLLRSLGFADIASITNDSISNIKVANTISVSENASSSPIPADLTKSMSAEARARVAERRLGPTPDPWSEFPHVKSDEAGQYQDVTHEKNVDSVGDGTMNRSPPSSSPLLCSKSVSLFFGTPSSSPAKSAFSFSTSLKPTYPLFIMPFSCQVGRVRAFSSEPSAVDEPFIYNPTKPRVRPRTTSEADEPSQPPSKRLRAADDANSSQMQYTPSFSEQPIYPNDTSSTITQTYPQAATQDASHSHQTRCVPLLQSGAEISSSVARVPSTSLTSISASPQQQLQQAQQQDFQKTTCNYNGDNSTAAVAQDQNGDVTIGMGVSQDSAGSHFAREGGTTAHREGHVSADLDTELADIIENPTSHGDGRSFDHNSLQDQNHATTLIDQSLDARSHSRSLQCEGLQLDVDGELRNDLINVRSLEATGGGGSGTGTGPVVGMGGTTKPNTNSDAPTVSGTNSGLGQPISKSQPQTVVAKQAERHSPTRTQGSTQSQSQPQPQQQQQQSQAGLSQYSSTCAQTLDGTKSQPQLYTILPTLTHPEQDPCSLQEHTQPQSPSSLLTIRARPKRQRLSTSASQPSSSSLLIDGGSSAVKSISSVLSLDELYKKAGLPGGYPGINEQGLRACRQCGKAGRYQNGKCVEKWNRGSYGPGTACSSCRRKMEKVDKQMQAAQTRDEMIPASDSFDSVTKHGDKSNSGDNPMVDSGYSGITPYNPFVGRSLKRAKKKDEGSTPNTSNGSSPADAVDVNHSVWVAPKAPM